MINEKLKNLIENDQNEMIAFRRELHKFPELSWEEFETTKKVAKKLDEFGIEYKLTKPTGIIAEIKGKKPGRTVALRADMDALPILELSDNIDYSSNHKGKMHACGHDAHTTMLLFAAKSLNKIKDELEGNVRLIFQPAEENAQGAIAMIKQGAIENVDAVFGMHVWPLMPAGKISCNIGSSFASADLVTIKFKGRGGHGSMPHDCVDAVIVASSFVMNLQAIIARETNPLESAVVTIGKIEAGTRFNVIAENAILEGTVRCFSIEMRDKIENAIKRYANHVAATFGAKAEVNYVYGTIPVINEEQSANLILNVAKEAFGNDVIHYVPPTTGGEDFSYFMENIPGAFALLGTGNSEKDTEWTLHHGRFNIDEDTLKKGAELHAQIAWNYLNNKQ